MNLRWSWLILWALVLQCCSRYKLPNEQFSTDCFQPLSRLENVKSALGSGIYGNVSGSLLVNYPDAHPGFGMYRKGYLRSKMYGWETHVYYFVDLLVENDSSVLLLTGPHINKMRPPGQEWLLLIDKKSGQIQRTVRLKGNLSHALYDGGIYFYQTSRGADRIYCLRVGD